LANLHHQAIPGYLDYFDRATATDRYFFLVQELVVGKSLATLVENRWRADEAQVQDIAEQILHVLDYLHQQAPPVIHRDIKPQNIIRDENGRVYLVDFGAVQDVYRTTLIEGGTFVGTVGYMPPEQFRGEAVAASDLYGLGATVLFLLTHRSPTDLPKKRMKLDFRDRVHVSPTFAQWLETMLEPAIEDRFESAPEALAFLLGKRNPQRDRIWQYESPKFKGSRVVVQKTAKQLEIEIPPATLRSAIAFLNPTRIFILLFWSTFFISAGMAFPCISFWLACLSCIAYRASGRVRLKIDRHTFRCQWQWLCFSKRVEKHPTQITWVKVIGDDNPACGFGTDDRPYYYCFGSRLTSIEQEWIVTEISTFLRRVPKVDRIHGTSG
ncbi:serine/threonine protein kinase, partial [Oscillatoriales cyanobacterium LEGE 11467]